MSVTSSGVPYTSGLCAQTEDTERARPSTIRNVNSLFIRTPFVGNWSDKDMGRGGGCQDKRPPERAKTAPGAHPGGCGPFDVSLLLALAQLVVELVDRRRARGDL